MTDARGLAMCRCGFSTPRMREKIEKEIARLAAENATAIMERIRGSFGHGAREDLWRPGENIADAVDRLVRKFDDLVLEILRLKSFAQRASDERNDLIDAVVAAYRKHKHDDENIGWNELTTILSNAGANALGDGEWLARVGAEDAEEYE